jgi:hypothetical protein
MVPTPRPKAQLQARAVVLKLHARLALDRPRLLLTRSAQYKTFATWSTFPQKIGNRIKSPVVRILSVFVAAAAVGCVDHSTNEPVAARTPKELDMSASEASWRVDPLLMDRFHPEYPDDVQVIIHDGGPRFTEKSPELVWVTVTSKIANTYRGKVLNQPQALTTVKQADEINFMAVAGAEYPFLVSQKYLDERAQWVIKPCEKCGFPELFDAPSDLVRKVFPNVRENEDVEVFTSFCPMCRGVQVIHKPGFEGR